MSFKLLLIMFFTLIHGGVFANNITDLERHAKEVPTESVDSEVIEYIKNETNEAVEGATSHYTLALFENKRSGRSWYILDGYYKLKSGKILFLDFIYRPRDKAWWPIENYMYYIPKSSERFMLEAEEVCNPYKRHFIGLISGYFSDINVLTKLVDFFEGKYATQPIFTFSNGNILIIDPTKFSRGGERVLFTLDEYNLVTKLKQELNLNTEVLPSGRAPSDENIKKTYIGVTGSCQK